MSGIQISYIILAVLILGFVGGIYAQKSLDEWDKKNNQKNNQ